MSEIMLLGVLRMPLPDDPKELDPMTWFQVKGRMRQAADEIERLRAAMTELVSAIDKRWADEPERKRANAISPRMEEAITTARAALEQ